jgi:hypothetical protein
MPGVWVTGAVPRRHPERNWNPAISMSRREAWYPTRFPRICRW